MRPPIESELACFGDEYTGVTVCIVDIKSTILNLYYSLICKYIRSTSDVDKSFFQFKSSLV